MTTTPSAVGAEARAVVQRLEHIHVSVGDLDRSLAFYRDVFGFAVRWQDDTDYGRCAHVGTDTFYVALTEKTDLKEARAAPGHAEVYHMGFTTEDLDALRARLERLGVEIAQEADRPEGAAIYLNDPDGHEIEVVRYHATYPYR